MSPPPLTIDNQRKEIASLYSIRTKWDGRRWHYINERENKTIEEINREIELLNDQAKIYNKYKIREWINFDFNITKEGVYTYFEYYYNKSTKNQNYETLSNNEIKKLKEEEEEFNRVMDEYKIKIKMNYWIILMDLLKLIDKPRAQKNEHLLIKKTKIMNMFELEKN
ncbi:hypothetical protein LLZ88_01900 [Ureaplasma urealyticum]|uniref:hypothetical protein n=1 Tax=Ureaplasma urealyticum TaxID=2130 RepID=UPI0003099A20|nr:hypothetical protein [Ureaplasma urealyticum]UIU14825.1 hypothetical protein LLZ88_01900 [Ureaplasma urealyticum]